MNNNLILKVCFLLFFPFYCFTQEDSLQMEQDLLNWRNIEHESSLINSGVVMSASRSLKKIKDLPVTTYIITKEEILRNGYVTLVDALKSLPGIRVSQPGSGLEGELFSMRGLLGNSYTKILINDVPFKPFVVRGLPIGSQLPIRQAERIEVIYGPGAALYGADASAGVINIVLSDSDRPFYTQVGAGLGGLSYSNVDLMLGGKLGSGKNVFNYKLYANNTSYRDIRTYKGGDELFNTSIYDDAFSSKIYLSHPNYKGSDTLAIVNALPHLSRMIGLEAKYQSFILTYRSMYRRDHSSLGYSPLAVSWANPLNYLGEEINDFQIQFAKQKQKFGYRTTFSSLFYKLDTGSSNNYVDNVLSQLLNGLFLEDKTIEDSLSISNQIQDLYFSGTRFNAAISRQFFIEQLFNFNIGKHIEWLLGGKVSTGNGRSMIYYLPDLIDNPNDIGFETTNFEWSAFSQLYLSFPKFNAILGGNFNQITTRRAESINFASTKTFSFNPRAAFIFKPYSTFSIRSSFGTAFLSPSPFYKSSTISLFIDAPLNLEINGQSFGQNKLEAERTLSAELGARWNPMPNLHTDVAFFHNRTKNFISFSAEADTSTFFFNVGYLNKQSSARLLGVQSRFIWKNIISDNRLNAELSFQYAWGKEVFFSPTSLLRDSINFIRGYPKYIGHLKLSIKPFSDLSIILDNSFIGGAFTQNTAILAERAFLEGSNVVQGNYLRLKPYYTLDVSGQYKLSNHLNVYIKLINLLDVNHSGIDVDSTFDILLYNPQQLFTFRLGMTYLLN